jgi:CRISPR type III-A-associated protein Csm2
MADEKKYKSFAEMSPSARGGGGWPPGQQRRQPAQAPTLPQDYLRAGYFDAHQDLLREVFIEWPEAITRSLRDSRPPATKNSLRAFYTMLRMAKTQFEAQRHGPDKATAREKAMGDARTQLFKLRTAAQYQRTRNVISPLCQSFLERNIDTVVSSGAEFDSFDKNFNAFVEHFQAVIAYLPERAER